MQLHRSEILEEEKEVETMKTDENKEKHDR
jgi:hypothetical protein